MNDLINFYNEKIIAFFEKEKVGFFRDCLGIALDRHEKLDALIFEWVVKTYFCNNFKQEIFALFIEKIKGEEFFRFLFEKLIEGTGFYEILQDVFYEILEEKLYEKENLEELLYQYNSICPPSLNKNQ